MDRSCATRRRFPCESSWTRTRERRRRPGRRDGAVSLTLPSSMEKAAAQRKADYHDDDRAAGVTLAIPRARRSLSPPLQAGPLMTRQTSLDATDPLVAPPARAFDAGLRAGPFPGPAASLLPGLLAATRTGLTQAGDDELVVVGSPEWPHLQLSGRTKNRGQRRGVTDGHDFDHRRVTRVPRGTCASLHPPLRLRGAPPTGKHRGSLSSRAERGNAAVGSHQLPLRTGCKRFLAAGERPRRLAVRIHRDRDGAVPLRRVGPRVMSLEASHGLR